MTAPIPTAPVLFIALDGCDADLMLRLVQQGRCPSLAALMSEAAVADTVAPYGTFVGSSWMTITMGTDVGTHRYWNWLDVDPTTYEVRGTTPREARGRPFWQSLSDAGRRVAMLDVPHCDVPDSFNGVILKEWGCHDRHDGTASFPASLLNDLDQTVGRHPVGCRDDPAGHDAFSPCDWVERSGLYRTQEEERRLLDLLRAGVEAKRRASIHVMQQERWDLFATVLGEAHCVGHQFWHLHDPSHPRHDPDTRSLLGNAVEDVYIRLDATIGDLVESAPSDASVYVHMNHGMGPHFDGAHLLDQILGRLDDAMQGSFTPGRWSQAGKQMYGHVPSPARGTARRALAAAARMKARRGAPVSEVALGPGPDRRFYQIRGNTAVGAIRFNVVGREGNGLVEPGAEFDRLRRELTEHLLDVTDIDSGRPLVRSVVRSDDVLQRSADDHLPDLFVEWDRSTLVERVWSPMTGTVAAPYDHWRTGDHHERGVFIARGAGITPGQRSESITLVDVAPTLAAALGVELPGVEGRVQWDLVGAAPAGAAPAGAGRARSAAADPARDAALGEIERRLEAQRHEIARLQHRVEIGERERLITNTMAWLAQEPVNDDVLVSVVTPTRARPERLAEAIRSVIAQRHQLWEMVIVDDGSFTAAPVIAAIGDDRVRLIEAEHGGACRARNIALDHAKGELIAYLDDDNRLDPGWLHSVVWAFGEHSTTTVLYGARMIDDAERVQGTGVGGPVWVQFNRFDRAALEQDNFTDMGVIAHRADERFRFEESLVEAGDWDFLLALTEHERPIELPAIALYYRTDAVDRLSGLCPSDKDVVRRKWARRRAGHAEPPETD